MRRIATDARLEILDRAITVATDRQDPDLVADAKATLERSRQRLARGPEQVVVALGGGTGSGKSSLSNALAGREISAVGPVRPTTDRAVVWTVGAPDQQLLDWLGAPDRQIVSPREDLPEGLVVLDLPDHDSIRSTHREIVDAAVKVVDVLAFVVDPLKYAQRALFEGYLRPLAHHADVVLVILNRADELDADGQRRCVSDLRRLLADTGLSRARVLLTSALTGAGIAELREVLADETRSRRAVAERINADVATVGETLGTDVDGARAVGDPGGVVSALVSAADLSGAVATARQTYRERGLQATRPPLTGLASGVARRAVRPFSRSAAQRLRQSGQLGGTDDEPVGAGNTAGGVDEFSRAPGGRIGGAHAAAPDLDQGRPLSGTDVALRHALRNLVDPVAEGLPDTWTLRLRRMVEDLSARLPAQTRDALDVVALHAPRRLWWSVVGLLWTLVELAVLVGTGWLLALFIIGWLQLPDPPTPQLGAVPWPTILVLAGVPLWLIIRALRASAVRRGAARHAARTAKRLRAQVAAATDVGLRPITAEVAARDQLLDLLGQIR